MDNDTEEFHDDNADSFFSTLDYLREAEEKISESKSGSRVADDVSSRIPDETSITTSANTGNVPPSARTRNMATSDISRKLPGDRRNYFKK
jgi:hypothetical protein